MLFLASCRFLGRRQIHSLNPNECCGAARQILKADQPSSFKKGQLTLTQDKVMLSFRLKSNAKKSAAQQATPKNSPPVLRRAAEHSFRSKSGSFTETTSPSSVSTHKKDDGLLDVIDLMISKPRPSSFSGHLEVDFPDYSELECMNDRIALIDVAYGITLDDRPEVFLLVSRHENHLMFHGFQFSSAEKSGAVKTALGERFKQAYEARLHAQQNKAETTTTVKQQASLNGKPPRLPVISVTNGDRMRHHKTGYSSSSSSSSSESSSNASSPVTAHQHSRKSRFLETLQALDSKLRLDADSSSSDESSK